MFEERWGGVSGLVQEAEKASQGATCAAADGCLLPPRILAERNSHVERSSRKDWDADGPERDDGSPPPTGKTVSTSQEVWEKILVMLIFEDDHLKITSRQTQSDQESNSILLSFTGIGHAMGGLNVQKPEFFGVGRSFDNIIFITDKTRSWGNRLNFNIVKEFIGPLIEKRKIYSIGNSMGGFNALVSTRYISTDICIAFAPQYSVKPSIVPWETRWKEYTSNIDIFIFENVGECINDTTKYFIFTGGKGQDFRHAKLFPIMKNVNHYSFPSFDHDVAMGLKEMGALDKLVQDCFRCAINLPQNIEYDRISPKSI